MNPNDLLRLAMLLKLQGETVRLFAIMDRAVNGEASRILSISAQIDVISDELKQLAKQLGASEAAE